MNQTGYSGPSSEGTLAPAAPATMVNIIEHDIVIRSSSSSGVAWVAYTRERERRVALAKARREAARREAE